MAGTARPGITGTSGPDNRSRRLALSSWRAARRTITTERTGTHAHARADRWRNIAQRSAAIAADLCSGVGCAQPVAACRALRIDALNSPSRQILHVSPPLESRAIFSALAPGPKDSRKKLPEFCAAALVVSREKIQSLVVRLQGDLNLAWRSEPAHENPPRNILSFFTTFRGLLTICASGT